ncbi:penicillin-binding protein 1C [Litoreibacter meonggei]|uniref:peptidoglycan glycosyltransferase n=1 Tax=Litoreibacter meonggei TaxID=1049199 RepID=A0A497WRY4_9RHOB|nr:penicillin-binding protein 1C [Litoreibacter meonggei]RLJ52014.1 penicillin-binding protein 1C [Litoreibacter meonggei]
MRLSRTFGLLAVALWAAAFGRDRFDHWIDRTEIPVLAIETGVEVLDRRGHLLRAFQTSDDRWRLAASVAEVDPEFLCLLIRYEDKRFYDHAGVDPVAMLRAAAQGVWNGRIVSGGSTLTMQVARLLEESGTGSWPGKLRQIRLALALERRLSKEQILSLYLVRAPYGGNLEGLRAATLAYYRKEPRRLTPTQAAMLIALPQSPESRRPDRFPERALRARKHVIERLVGAGALTPEDRSGQALRAKRHEFAALAPHLTDRIRNTNGGQLVRTTLDVGIQRKLERMAANAVATAGRHLSVAMMVADHQTGEIIASVGSASYANDRRGGFIDMTQARRSPGSTLKPLIYGMGFDQGLIHPETLVSDRPMQFGAYAPQNFDGVFRGDIRVRQALQASLNLPVVSILDRLGPANLIAKLRQAGASPQLAGDQAGLAIALGGLGLSLSELVQLYAVIAQPDRAKTLAATQGAIAPLPPVLSKRASWYIGDILKGVPRPAMAGRKDVAFKTGTSYGHRDAWAIGYDGRHVVGVWMGRADGTPVPGAFGGELAAPLMFQAFDKIKPDSDPLPAPPRDALLSGNAELPQPLQRFISRVEQRGVAQDHPKVAFPPDGARVALRGGALTVQIRDGVAPFTWMQNGTPVLTNSWDRQAQLVPSGRGYVQVRVIDARGRATGTTVFAE